MSCIECETMYHSISIQHTPKINVLCKYRWYRPSYDFYVDPICSSNGAFSIQTRVGRDGILDKCCHAENSKWSYWDCKENFQETRLFQLPS